MKTPSRSKFLCALVLAAMLLTGRAASADPHNPNIDMRAYLKVANEAAGFRRSRRVTEDEFIRMSAEPGTVILDARSSAKFFLLHIKGAINLSFPDMDIASLGKTFPDKNQRILIYCNNNFRGNQDAFASKAPSASLNLSTYIALYSYGYRNVYELAPYIDLKTTKLPMTGSATR